MTARLELLDTSYSGTIISPAEGEIITPSLPSGHRIMMLVSREDYDLVSRSLGRDGSPIEVTDLVTGFTHWLSPAPCGGGCYCAMEIN